MNIFISYAQEDMARIGVITYALDSWNLKYWVPPRQDANATQTNQVQQILTETDAFLRICTPATPRSYWMTLEQTAFLSFQSEDFRKGGPQLRKLINIVLDGTYQKKPFDYADPIIDASSGERWRNELHDVLLKS